MLRRSLKAQIPLILSFVLQATNVLAGGAAEVLAFPGAEGPGRFTTGGRGGTVFVVTNLAAAGPGTLADAVSQSNRFVVFGVSGIIDLARAGKGKGGKVLLEQPNITIAGQTAPGEGICLRGGSLNVRADNVILRYLRSRRGFVKEGDMGDAIEVKPFNGGEAQVAVGRTQEKFDKIKAKKSSRGGVLSKPGVAANIILDHLSASWATDENLTMTHADRSTMQWCIAAEGLDYHNPNQTPPNHSEGSLWGSSAPGGQSAAHHLLYAHNRLRNPRTTGGQMPPAELTLYNSVIYNWSEEATHSSSEAIYLNLLNNYYKPGPDTPPDLRRIFFEFRCDPRGRVFAAGNLLDGAPDCSADNSKGLVWAEKGNLTRVQRRSMLSPVLLGEPPASLQTAPEALASVLLDAGATLPARDAVDWRIVESVRTGQGRILAKETELPAAERWPDYVSLPAPADRDHDGLPDFWEEQFGLNPDDPTDSMRISAGGYANLEHYCNNTDPRGGNTPIVFVSAPVSRASAGNMQSGSIRFNRSRADAAPLEVRYAISGDGHSGSDFAPLSGVVIIRPGAGSAEVPIVPLKQGRGLVVLTPQPNPAYHIGCPSAALVVIGQ
jgi:hypothetical protein